MKPARKSSSTGSVRPSNPVMLFGQTYAVRRFLDRVGTPTERLLQKAGLPVFCERVDAVVPLYSGWSFYDSVDRLDVDGLGWLAGQWARDEYLSPALLVQLRRAPTLSVALDRLARVATVQNSHIKLGVIETDEDVLVWIRNTVGNSVAGYHCSQALALTALLYIVRHFLGEDWLPREVGIEAAEVPETVASVLPGTRIVPAQTTGYLRLPKTGLLAEWDQAGDAEKAASSGALRELDRIELPALIREIVETYIQDSCPTLVATAAMIGTSSRTLNRHLATQGLTYSTLIEQTRFAVAKPLLEDPDNPLIDIAAAVGYSDPSHFSRAFKRIAGVTPSSYRDWFASGALVSEPVTLESRA